MITRATNLKLMILAIASIVGMMSFYVHHKLYISVAVAGAVLLISLLRYLFIRRDRETFFLKFFCLLFYGGIVGFLGTPALIALWTHHLWREFICLCVVLVSATLTFRGKDVSADIRLISNLFDLRA